VSTGQKIPPLCIDRIADIPIFIYGVLSLFIYFLNIYNGKGSLKLAAIANANLH
jgi:hypothetical protein